MSNWNEYTAINNKSNQSPHNIPLRYTNKRNSSLICVKHKITIDLSFKNITIIPNRIFIFDYIHLLDISNNNIKSISYRILYIKFKYLFCNNNSFLTSQKIRSLNKKTIFNLSVDNKGNEPTKFDFFTMQLKNIRHNMIKHYDICANCNNKSIKMTKLYKRIYLNNIPITCHYNFCNLECYQGFIDYFNDSEFFEY